MKTARLVTSTLVAVGLTALLGGSLTGCANQSESNAPLTITWEVGTKDAMEAVLVAFKEENPDAVVNVDYLDPDALATRLSTQLKGGTGPDLFRANPGQGTSVSVLGLAKEQLLSPIDLPSGTSLTESQKQILNIGDETYGLPLTLTNISQILNVDLLEQYQLTAPTTFDEVLSFCRAARAAGTVAYTAGPASSFEARSVIYALSDETVYYDDPDFAEQVNAGKQTWQDSGWVEAINRNLEMVQAGCFPDDFTSTDVGGAFGQLFGGQVLGIVGYGGYLSYAPAGTHFEAYPLPASNNASNSGMVVSPFQTMVMNAQAKNPALAKKFIEFITTPENNELYASKASANGGIVAFFRGAQSSESTQVNQQILSYLENGHSNPFPDASFPDSMVTETLETHMQKALAGKETAKEVAAAVQAAWEKAISKNK